MDSEGHIYNETQQQELGAAKRKQLALIPNADLPRVKKMSKAARRRWFAQQMADAPPIDQEAAKEERRLARNKRKALARKQRCAT